MPKPVLLTQGPEFTPEFTFSVDASFLHAGEGDFTCCARNHDFGAGPVPCDKLKVRAILEQMLESRYGRSADKYVANELGVINSTLRTEHAEIRDDKGWGKA